MGKYFHRRSQKDKNHDQIANALRKAGWSVEDTHMVKNGFPDMVLGKCGITLLGEAKDLERGKAEESQIELEQRWKGSKILKFYTPEQAVTCAEGALARMLGEANATH